MLNPGSSMYNIDNESVNVCVCMPAVVHRFLKSSLIYCSFNSRVSLLICTDHIHMLIWLLQLNPIAIIMILSLCHVHLLTFKKETLPEVEGRVGSDPDDSE